MKNKKNTIIPFKITCSVRSYSHRLNNEAFSFLMSGDKNIFVTEVKEKSFLLSCVNERADYKTVEHFALIAHFCFSNFIMALNIATLGRFTWDLGISALPMYKLVGPQNEEDTKTILLQMVKKKDNDIIDITKNEIQNTALLYGALAKEKESNVRKEYLKGILHLSLDFFDIDFHREAFGNFYRSFENFTTERILKVRKLTNELKQMQKVIIDFGLGNNVAEEFHCLYQLRSNQIMHAQKKQVEIKMDDVLNIKAILDFILHKVYQPIWEKGIKNLRAKNKKPEYNMH